MIKFFYLSTCSTCKRILSQLDLPSNSVLQDIKSDPITAEQLEEMRRRTDSYESLFSKRAQLFRQRELQTKALSEEDYKMLILEHYTFLKRPVLLLDDTLFIGNSKKTVAAAQKALANL